MAPYSKNSMRGYVVGLHRTMSYRQIAALPEVSVSLKTIKRWCARFRDEGFDGLETRPKTGRPKATTPEQDADIRASVLAQPKRSTLAIVRELYPENEASMSTIYRRYVNVQGINDTARAFERKF